MARTYPANLPDRYASDYLAKVERWSRGDEGVVIRAFWPRLFQSPVACAYGFAANGDPNEDTPPSAGAFSATGMFGATTGPSGRRKPNCDRSVENAWCDYHATPIIREFLGRDACMTLDCWRPENGGLPDQTAIGMVSLAQHAESMQRALPPDLRATDRGLWYTALAFMGWSAGSPTAAPHLLRYAAALRAVPEPARFAAFERAAALVAYTAPAATAYSYRNDGHLATRTAQKLRLGLLLDAIWSRRGDVRACGARGCDPLGLLALVYDPVAQAWIDQCLALRAAGRVPRAAGLPPPPSRFESLGALVASLY